MWRGWASACCCWGGGALRIAALALLLVIVFQSFETYGFNMTSFGTVIAKKIFFLAVSCLMIACTLEAPHRPHVQPCREAPAVPAKSSAASGSVLFRRLLGSAYLVQFEREFLCLCFQSFFHQFETLKSL